MLALAFRTHQPVMPRTGNDTVKPLLRYTTTKSLPSKDSVDTFIYLYHYGETLPLELPPLKYKAGMCFEYKSDYGYKLCGENWFIRDTMGLINALYYDAWMMGKRD